MPKVVGGLMALIALAACILSKVEPYSCLIRAVIAYVIGYTATQLWYVFFTVRAYRTGESVSDGGAETHGL